MKVSHSCAFVPFYAAISCMFLFRASGTQWFTINLQHANFFYSLIAIFALFAMLCDHFFLFLLMKLKQIKCWQFLLFPFACHRYYLTLNYHHLLCSSSSAKAFCCCLIDGGQINSQKCNKNKQEYAIKTVSTIHAII